MKRHISIVFVAAFAASGCAQLKFGDASQPGVPFYTPQPMITRTVAENCTISTSMIVVPNTDAAHTRTVSTTVGIGSNKLEASFQNGMITSFGQTTDTKIPETLNALSTMVGTLVKSGSEESLVNAGDPKKVETCNPVFEVFRVDAGGTLTRVYPSS